MYVVVVGGGQIGTYLLGLLSDEGHNVTIIEKNEEISKGIAEHYDAIVIHGDGADMKLLADANADKADVLAAVTEDDKVNLVACQIAKSNFGVPKTIARVNDPKNIEVFKGFGVDHPVSTTIAAATEIKNSISGIKTVALLSGGSAELVEVRLGEESPVVGKIIKRAGFPDGCNIAAIYRDNDLIIPSGNTKLIENDMITAIVKLNVSKKVRRLLTGQ